MNDRTLWSACDETLPNEPIVDMVRKLATGSLLAKFRMMNYIEFISIAISIGITRNMGGECDAQTIYCLYSSDYRAL